MRFVVGIDLILIISKQKSNTLLQMIKGKRL